MKGREPIEHFSRPEHSEGSERQAEMDLFAGAIGHPKNPPGHRDVKLPPPEAARLIVFAAHLLDITAKR